MDDSRFDALTRGFTNARSRRGALSALLGGTLGLLGLAGTTAKKSKSNGEGMKKSCPSCRKRKAGKCKGKKADGTACENGGQCHNGSCISPAQAAPPPPGDDSSPPPLSRTCPAGNCNPHLVNSCGPRCVCLDIGGEGVTHRCLTAGTCSADICTETSCERGCTCINPGGVKSRCVSVGECPSEQCESDNDCGPDCICVNPGSNAARCASVVR
jgi:hypothetical protein